MSRSFSSKNRHQSKKPSYTKSKVRFTDQVMLLESIKESDIENVKQLLRRQSACIDIGVINNSGN